MGSEIKGGVRNSHGIKKELRTFGSDAFGLDPYSTDRDRDTERD